ncbi:hypothetical protein [Azovibrio restrictus]|uniref:hypothetical protein n=1 Tax=Azovibrio restrictus TaxID=146938 RepID=UPI0026ED6569|nr:hypothetical protein [Azovibrio restrictus]MDD3482985.1 hypothetical protein [Azovibrio restrictus]
MELSDYIEMGIRKTESKTVKELAELIGMKRENLSAAKRHKSGIAPYAATKLAQIVGVEPLEVIAASELVTEKNDERRKFWSPFVEHARAACMLIALGSVTNFVTPSPAVASTTGQNYDGIQVVKIMRNSGYTSPN